MTLPVSTSWIIDQLKAKKERITPARKAVAEWIGAHDGVFSPKEIIKACDGIDRVTIYRILDLFESHDLIHLALVQHGEKHYELHGEQHYHHVICTDCEVTSRIDCEVTVKDVKGFSNLHHSVVFTGLCDTCVA